MAKKRQLNNVDPVRRSDINALMKASPFKSPVSGNYSYDGIVVRDTTPPETILRWFRVLTNSEAAAASAAGLIPEQDLATNNMVNRLVEKCDGTTTTEPEPSMWAIQITRYNCNETYLDKDFRYSLVRWPAIQSGANLTEIGTDLKDERVLCWWNSNSGHWEVLENPAEGETVPPEATDCCMDFVQVCTNVANECCLLEGIRIHVDPVNTTNFCTPKTCIIPIWLWCYQGLRAGQEVDLAIHHCEFGKLIKSDFYCLGDTRDVYGIKCGPCSAPCPRKEVKVTVKAKECIADDVIFTAYCIDDNPLRDPLGDPTPGFWGEFELTGEYPMVGIPVSVEEFDFEYDGDTISVQTVYVIVGCRESASDRLCEADITYISIGGGAVYVPFDGTFTVTGFPPADPEPILGEDDCIISCTRTFRYGIFFPCSDGVLGPGKFYRLHRGTMASDGEIDPCANITVPEAGDSVNGTGDDVDFSSYTGAICETFDKATIDVDYGVSYSCDVTLLKDTGLSTIEANPYAYDIFGGCRSWWHLRGLGAGICEDAAESDFVTLEFDWSGSDECKDQ